MAANLLLIATTISLGLGAHAKSQRRGAQPGPAQAKSAPCGDITPEAKARYLKCAGSTSLSDDKKSIIVDADANLAWIVSAKSGGSPQCVPVGVGVNSKGGSGNASLGNTDSSFKTPPGWLVTFRKRDTKGPFKSFDDFVGLKGTSSVNGITDVPRGVLLHTCAATGYTHGCICFKDGNFPKVRDVIRKQNNENGTVVYVYSKSMSSNGCPSPGGAGRIQSVDASPAAGVVK